MFRIQDRGRIFSAADLRDTSRWREISRDEAFSAVSVDRVVIVYRNASSDCVDWFDSGHPFFQGVGPHWLGGVRYYRQRGQRVRPAEAGAAPAATPDVRRAPTRAVRQPPASEVIQKTWIEIELLDEKGAPVRNERYTILLPDGSTRGGTLDSLGRARVDGIDPGVCEVCFPEIDQRAWRAA